MADKTGKRPSGEGSVYQEGDKWRCAVTVDGTRIRRTFATEAEAERERKRLVKLRDQGMLAATRMKLGVYLSEWLQLVKRHDVSDRTYMQMERRVERITAIIGAVPLGKLEPRHIRRLHHTLSQQGLKARTIEQYHIHLAEALRDAVKDRLLPRSPAEYVDPPAWRTVPRPTLDMGQTLSLLEELQTDPLYALYVLLAMTGMRIGEALALHWDDMSLDTGRVHIHRNLVRYTAKAWEFVPPKTDSGDRHIILDSMALDAMKAHREQSPAGHALVFAQADGTPIYHTNVGRAMTAALKRAGLPHIRVHDLRHSFASTMARKVGANILQRQLGHSSVNVTLGIYVHVFRSQEREVAEGIERAVDEARKKRTEGTQEVG